MANATTQAKAVDVAEFEAELKQMDEGVRQTLPAGASIMIAGVNVPQNVIDATLQGWIAAFKAVHTAEAAYKEAVAARRAITVAARTYYKALKAAIKTAFAHSSAALATFGIAADKPVVKTTKEKMVATGKAAQTREVRGTMSKKAKAAITVVGNPPVSIGSDGKVEVGPTPINAPPGGASSPAPSGSGSGGDNPTGGSKPDGA